MSRTIVVAVACLACAVLVRGAAAQELPAAPPGYIPLFTQEQIEKATPETRARMIETERLNREGWAERARSTPTVGGDSRDESEPDPDSKPVATAPKPAGRRKIYRWVDADGRVNFGDNPPASAAQEVKLQGTAAASSGGGDASARPPTSAGSDTD